VEGEGLSEEEDEEEEKEEEEGGVWRGNGVCIGWGGVSSLASGWRSMSSNFSPIL